MISLTMLSLPAIEIDLERVRANARSIRARTGVALFPTLKADGYGLGAAPLARALSDIADGFCVFSLAEALALRPHVPSETPIRTLGPSDLAQVEQYRAHNVMPCITGAEAARAFAGQPSVICIDTGFGRLAAPIDDLDGLLELSGSLEVMTLLVDEAAIERFEAATANRRLFRHAAASGQLDNPRTHFDATRPGLALFAGAVRVTCAVHEVQTPTHASGYSRFSSRRYGVILIGYAMGLRPGPCLVDGAPSRIIDVGMQTACVALEPRQGVGAIVTLLGEGLGASEVASAWNCRPHEVLTSMGRIPAKRYPNESGRNP